MLSIIKHEDENTRMMTRRIILQGENSSFWTFSPPAQQDPGRSTQQPNRDSRAAGWNKVRNATSFCNRQLYRLTCQTSTSNCHSAYAETDWQLETCMVMQMQGKEHRTPIKPTALHLHTNKGQPH
jgi:hypothetical protein